MGALTIKCPSCGNNLEYVPGSGRLECPMCSHTLSEEELEALFPVRGTPLKSYHCQNCGAEIVTDETTAATRCYFCHSPVVLTERFSDDFRPDAVIPFAFDQDEAKTHFRTFLSKKKFLDKRFLSDDQMEMLSGVYYPYFIGKIEGEAEFEGEGRKVSTVNSGQYVVTTTRYYRVSRNAKMCFSNLQRKALRSVNAKLSDGMHPYDLKKLVPFSFPYLSGFLAEIRDMPIEEAQEDMKREIKGYVPALIKRGNPYDSLSGKTEFRTYEEKVQYVLLPAYLLTYQGKTPEEPYYYMMNGQTGTVCGKLPLNRKKLALFSLLLGTVACALLMMGGSFIW